MTDDVKVTPTEYLMMEVLAARYRLGEALWSFDSSTTPAARKLETRRWVGWKSGPVERSIQVWLTEAGIAAWKLDVPYPPEQPPVPGVTPTSNEFRYANVSSTTAATSANVSSTTTSPNSSIMAMWREDQLEGTRGDFWEMTVDGWRSVDVSEHVARHELAERGYAEDAKRAEEQHPWRLWVFGPSDSLAQWWSSFPTEAAAREAAAKLPSVLQPTVSNSASPRRHR